MGDPMKRPLFSGRQERQRIETWLRERRPRDATRLAALVIANEIANEVDVEATQDLRDAKDYPTAADAAGAIGGWATHYRLTEDESEAMKRIADRLAGLPESADE